MIFQEQKVKKREGFIKTKGLDFQIYLKDMQQICQINLTFQVSGFKRNKMRPININSLLFKI